MSTQTTTPGAARESNGQFGKGNSGGPGNPFGAQMAANGQVILDTVRDDDIRSIMESLLQQGHKGNVAAFRLVLLYTVGKPQPDADLAAPEQVASHPSADAGPPKPPFDPKDNRLDAEAGAAEKAAVQAEAGPVIAHIMKHGDWPSDCALAIAAAQLSPDDAAAFRRFFAQCLRDGKFPNDSPFNPLLDGIPAAQRREAAKKFAVKPVA